MFNLIYTHNDDYFEWNTHTYLVILISVDIVILDYAGNFCLKVLDPKAVNNWKERLLVTSSYQFQLVKAVQLLSLLE